MKVVSISLTFLFLAHTSFAIKKPLGPAINSPYDELAPVFSPDGKTLYFCREGHPENTGYEKRKDDQDIWMSKKMPDGKWATAKRLDAVFNSPYYDFPIGVSGDGSILYIGNQYRANGVILPGVSRSRFIRGKWQAPQALQIEDYYNNASLVNYYMAPDENTLLLNLKREDTYGSMDIYVSFRNENGTWSKPMNLGMDINSGYTEVTPFIASDRKTLYFASDRPKGFGGFDMYYSKRLDDTWKRWSRPKNMGSEINSKGNDISYIIDPTGEYALYSSDTPDEGKNLFMVDLPNEFKPERTTLLEGRVFDDQNKPISARIFYERLSDGKRIGQTESNPESGTFQFILPQGEKYGVHAEKENFLSVSRAIDTRETSDRVIKMDIGMSPIKKGTRISLNNIFFATGSHKLTKESFGELQRLAKILKENSNMKIEVAGHTDNVGRAKKNQVLSAKRAMAVRNWLIKNGSNPKQITSKGYGQKKPVANNNTIAGRKANRRVEFEIIGL